MTDDKRTTDARLLDESIAHWDRLLALYLAEDLEGLNEEGWHSDSCALCSIYLDDNDKCVGCPVYNDTGQNMCKGSSWGDAAHACWCFVYLDPPIDNRADAIRAQGDYLRRLRAELGDVT